MLKIDGVRSFILHILHEVTIEIYLISLIIFLKLHYIYSIYETPN